jgi:hypothetical protein
MTPPADGGAVRGGDALRAKLDEIDGRGNRDSLQLRTIKDVKATPVQLDLMRGLLPGGPAIVLVWGESSVGKSFWTSAVVFYLAMGRPWNGRRTRQTGVVYISSEGRMGLRIQAFEQVQGVNLDDLNFRLIETGLDLSNSDKADIDRLIEAVEALDMPVGVLVIDTLARNFGGGDPDKSGDMSRFVEACGRFSRAFEAVVIAIHHPGKDATKGPRNSYALTAGVDTQISIKAEGDTRLVEVEKQRDGRTGIVEAFDLKVVDLGPHPDPDADDDERLTSCVVVPVAADGVVRPKRAKESGQTRMARDVLSQAIGEIGEALPQTTSIPCGVRGVRLEQWRARFVNRYGTDRAEKDSTGAGRKAFARAKDKLLETGDIQISDPWVWICR